MITYHVMWNKPRWEVFQKKHVCWQNHKNIWNAILDVFKTAHAFAGSDGISIHIHDKSHKLRQIIVVRDVS